MRKPSYHLAHLLLLVSLPIWAWQASTYGITPTVTLFGWLVANALVLGLAEYLWPHRHDWHPNRAHLQRDAAVWSMNVLTDAAVSAGLVAVAMVWLPGQSTWPLGLQIVVGALAVEFGSYWLHRLSHRDGWLWRVHVMHHRPERLNVANALMAHPINAAYDKLAKTLPLIALGLQPDAVLVISLFGLTQTLVTHANVAGRLGWLNYLIGTAELHRLHHSTREYDAGNFGTSLPFWDLVFGTFRYGPAPKAVGVFEPQKYPDELQVRKFLAWPFSSALPGRVWRLRCCLRP